MKTIDEWLQHYATRVSTQFDLRDLIKEIRREAFERCEQEARRLKEAYGWEVADTLQEVYREEGDK